MLLYIIGFNKYRKRLDKLTDELLDRADGRNTAYQALRDKDPAFFSYYKGLPDYNPCPSNVNRSRGAAFADYGRALRRSLKTVNGYTQLQRVNLVGGFAENAVFATAVGSVMTEIAERRRVDDHVLRRWQAIVSAPTHAAHKDDYSSIIKSSFSSMRAFGQGANSAGVALGTQLYKGNYFG
jgi:hypothetical protein